MCWRSLSKMKMCGDPSLAQEANATQARFRFSGKMGGMKLIWITSVVSATKCALIQAHNRAVKQTGQGVRLVLPVAVKAPESNPIEPHGLCQTAGGRARGDFVRRNWRASVRRLRPPA